MLKMRPLTPALAAACFALVLSDQAWAQEGATQVPPTVGGEASREDARATTSHVGRVRNSRRNQPDRQPAPPSPEEIRATAQALAAVAAPTCQVTEATKSSLVTAQQEAIYEAACGSGPGYILIASTPPQGLDCVLLAGQADIERRADPAADVGVQCVLPANTNVTRVIAAYAKEAGVACTVDQAASIGKSPEDNLIYEVGCNGTDGYWLERVGATWEKTSCLQLVSQNGSCRFTTPQEQAASLKTILAGSDAAACNVTQARYMGANANGTFYEAKCAAGDGYIARVNAEMAVQQVYPCAQAQRIGGGCTLTPVAPATNEPAPAPATR